MLRVQNERLDVNYFPSTREYTQQYGCNQELLDSLNKEIVIMHPGPINRGVEISSDVADSQQSVILDQVEENGVAVRMAVIYYWQVKLKISILAIILYNNYESRSKGHTTIIKDTQNNLESFVQKVTNEYHVFQGQNLILDLSHDKTFATKDLAQFKDLAKNHKKLSH